MRRGGGAAGAARIVTMPQTPAAQPLSAPQKALQRLGLVRPIDLALHLPLRYEDETQVTPIAALRPADKAQVEGRIVESRVEGRARRQFVARMTDDSGGELLLR